MSGKFEYKPVVREMIYEIAELFSETFNDEPWNDNWTLSIAVKRIDFILSADGFYGLAAYRDGVMCGFILGWAEQYCDAKEFAIREFAVRNNERGSGIGTELYNEFEKNLKKTGINKITLLTLKNDFTQRFYEKIGFQTNEKIVFMNKNIY